MQLAWYVVYIGLGSSLGYLYGRLFLAEKRGALFRIIPTDELDKQRKIPIGFFPNLLWTVLRLLLLAISLVYLLPLGTIPIILVMISFLLFFWFIVSRKTRGNG